MARAVAAKAKPAAKRPSRAKKAVEKAVEKVAEVVSNVPEPLRLARQARVAEDPMTVVTPMQLYEMCGNDGQLHNHAMREAGYLKHGPRPEDPCLTCGWSVSEHGATPEEEASAAAEQAERERLEAEADAKLEAEAEALEAQQEAAAP